MIHLKKAVAVSAMGAMLIGGGMSVAAEINSVDYNYYVSKDDSYRSPEPVMKVNGNDKASNQVDSIDEGCAFQSWILNYLGNPISTKAKYTEPDTYLMEYNHPGETGRAYIVISTQLFKNKAGNTSGKWSPDEL